MTTLYKTDSTAVPARAIDLFGASRIEEMGGDKYSTKKIAQRIRGDIKTAIAEGLIRKGVKVSVRMDGRNAIYLTITAAPFLLQNPDAIVERAASRNFTEWRCEPLRPETQTILNILSLIEQQYNYDNSDVMSDYFDVNFYCWPSIDSDLEYAERDGVLALAAQGLKVRAAA